jgi:hypothetical protein
MSTPLGPFRRFLPCSPVSLTPAIHPCHGFSVIAGVVDTGDKFIASDNATGDKFIAGDNDTGDKFIAADNNVGD